MRTEAQLTTLLYAAAHADFPDTEPLGGGKAVADYLIRQWREEAAFDLRVLSPNSLRLPLPKPLAQLSELEYARFCRQFERAATAEILHHDPRGCMVLANDISEGPNFRTLGEKSYRITTIFHVDVVEYCTKFYLRNLIPPSLLTRWTAFRLMPNVLQLVFQKQYECVRYSARIVVPSEPMRATILKCYPWCAPEKIAVLPWGDVSESTPAPPLNIPEDDFVVITLSRLSPEKGIERLLKALPLVKAAKLRVYICGGPAYMKGQAYERELRRLASQVTTARIEFTGHVTGARKAALLQRADLFVSPSRHESYGLTIAEAKAAGCRIISHHHYGATGTIVDCAQPDQLARALSEMISTGRTRKTVSPQSPSHAADHLAQLLMATAA